MGRLSEYVNGQLQKASSPRASRTVSTNGMEVIGLGEVQELLGRIMTDHPDMMKELKTALREILRDARNRTSQDIRGYLSDDPRKAYRAVRSSMYKSILGGNINILTKRRAGAKYELKRQRKLDANPHQRGGNRRPRSAETERMDRYFGADRGFILRFLNSGTVQRQTRYGNRGSLNPSGLFINNATREMDIAAEELKEFINEYIEALQNG